MSVDDVGPLGLNVGPAVTELTLGGSGNVVLNAALGAYGVNKIGGGTMTLGTNERLSSAAGTTVTVTAGTLNLNGFTQSVANLAMKGSTVATGAGILTVAGTGSIAYTGGASDTQATISGNVNLGAANRTINVADGGAATDMLISAVVTGDPGVGIIKTGAGRLELTGANTFSGAAVVKNGALGLRRQRGRQHQRSAGQHRQPVTVGDAVEGTDAGLLATADNRILPCRSIWLPETAPGFWAPPPPAPTAPRSPASSAAAATWLFRPLGRAGQAQQRCQHVQRQGEHPQRLPVRDMPPAPAPDAGHEEIIIGATGSQQRTRASSSTTPPSRRPGRSTWSRATPVRPTSPQPQRAAR